jgi:isochorismate synthase
VTTSTERAPVAAGTNRSGDLRAILVPHLERAASRERSTLVSVVTVLDRVVRPRAVYAAARRLGEAPTLWLQPDEGVALVGLGSAWSVRASGAGRFGAVGRAWAELVTDALVTGDEATATGPLLLGGLGFGDAPAVSPTWRGFEAASLVLPDLLLTVTEHRAWLTASRVMAPGEPATPVAEELSARWSAVVAAAHDVGPGPDGHAGSTSLRLVARRPDAIAWRDSVARLAGAVGRGRVDKVVLARAVDLVAGAAIDVPAVLARLRDSAPESTVFAVDRDGRTFLGASPERLVRVSGTSVRSVALAGSAPRTGDATRDTSLAADLLEDDKEREEHAVVVTMLRETLAPLASELLIAMQPRVMALEHVQHLATSVTATLREPQGVLRLAERLHPTPAVGGAPRDLALELIGEEEDLERGWYAGPLGWLDRRGDGDLVVALRAGVVDGERATLLAGCGIMADSDADREWAESTSKLRALGSALGGIET